jgi:hypothetical protein
MTKRQTPCTLLLMHIWIDVGKPVGTGRGSGCLLYSVPRLVLFYLHCAGNSDKLEDERIQKFRQQNTKVCLCIVLLRCSDVLTCACFLRLDRAAVFRPEARTAAVVRIRLARHSRHCRRSALPSQEAPRTVYSHCLCVCVCLWKSLHARAV